MFVLVFLAGPAKSPSLDAAVARKCSFSPVNSEMLMLSVPISSFILHPSTNLHTKASSGEAGGRGLTEPKGR